MRVSVKLNILVIIFVHLSCEMCHITCNTEVPGQDSLALETDQEPGPCPNGFCKEGEKRYILYEVNAGEGFNLRRDIYIRIAPLVHSLNREDQAHKWILVLPPWGRLPHWRNTPSSKLFHWKSFFDVQKIKDYIPAIEFEEYLQEYGLDNPMDLVYQLQHFPFQEPMVDWKEEIETNVPCEDTFAYKLDKTLGYYTGHFWKHQLQAREAMCMALRGQASTLKKFLLEIDAKSIMFDRAEVILWDHYGGKEWWEARVSLRFAEPLIQAAEQFLKEHDLSQSLPASQSKYYHHAKNYIGVHLRRRDFLHGRQNDLPSLKGAAVQIITISKRFSLSDVLVATDADETDFDKLKDEIRKYSNDTPQLHLHQYSCQSPFSDGECAIIDQILCSYSKFFIGTKDSTFTFRIYEEREILGIPSDQTYNHLCPDDLQTPCKKPTQWRIPFRTNVY